MQNPPQISFWHQFWSPFVTHFIFGPPICPFCFVLLGWRFVSRSHHSIHAHAWKDPNKKHQDQSKPTFNRKNSRNKTLLRRRCNVCFESFDLTQVAKGGQIAKCRTKKWKSRFRTRPRDFHSRIQCQNSIESTENQPLTLIIRPMRGTFYFWFTNLSVLLRCARMAICVKVEPLNTWVLDTFCFLQR